MLRGSCSILDTVRTRRNVTSAVTRWVVHHVVVACDHGAVAAEV